MTLDSISFNIFYYFPQSWLLPNCQCPHKPSPTLLSFMNCHGDLISCFDMLMLCTCYVHEDLKSCYDILMLRRRPPKDIVKVEAEKCDIVFETMWSVGPLGWIVVDAGCIRRAQILDATMKKIVTTIRLHVNSYQKFYWWIFNSSTIHPPITKYLP